MLMQVINTNYLTPIIITEMIKVIKEEYDYQDINEYLFKNIDLIITGEPTNEERSTFIIKSWSEKKKPCLSISPDGIDKIKYTYYNPLLNEFESLDNINITIGLPDILKKQNISHKNILLDLSSLDHVVIMVLIKQLIKHIFPKSLFAVYIRPKRYLPLVESDGLLLSDKINKIRAIPGFVKREVEKQTLCSFIGFEGIRFKAALESENNIEKIIPIVTFPSGGLQWYKTTMWYSMSILESETREFTIHKCLSESIFDAVILLNDVLSQSNSIVLAPLGTRPHSVASAIYAAKNPNTKIIYDYADEKKKRTEGITYICVYHLSGFINT